MSAGLHIASRLYLPLEAVTETFAFLGRRSNGKTYAAMVMAEQMLDVGAQIVVLDPVGAWWGCAAWFSARCPIRHCRFRRRTAVSASVRSLPH